MSLMRTSRHLFPTHNVRSWWNSLRVCTEGPRLPKLKEDVPAIARVEKLDHPNRITITSPTLAPNKIASSKRGAAGGSYPVSLLYILLLVAGDADGDDSDHGNRWKQSVNKRQDARWPTQIYTAKVLHPLDLQYSAKDHREMVSVPSTWPLPGCFRIIIEQM